MQWVGLVLVVAFVRLLFLYFVRDRRLRQRRSLDFVQGIAAELRGLLYAGDWDGFEAREKRAWVELEALSYDDGNLVATQLSLVRAEYGVVRGGPEVVREGLDAAADNATRIPAADRREFELQAAAIAGIALDPGAPEEDFLRRGDAALAGAGEALWVRTRVLIAQAALQVARARHARGEHEAAEAATRQALVLARQPDLGEARPLASLAATEAGLRRLEAGSAAGAEEWFGIAEQILGDDATPEGRRQLAYLLVIRALRTPGDLLLDAGTRRARFERAREAARDLESADGRMLFARASDELAHILGATGEHAKAVACFAEGIARLAGLTDRDATRIRIEGRISCGQARLAAQDLGAAGEFQLAMDEAAAHEDPVIRALALPAATALGGMLANSGMHAHAAEVVERARQVAADAPADDRERLLARVDYEQAGLDRLAGRPEAARERLLGVLAATAKAGAAGDPLRRAALAALGRVALAAGEAEEADGRLREALAMAWDDDPQSDADRAETEWHLASAAIRLGRVAEARAIYERAFERGRASGVRDGRYAAAQSAFQLAEHADLAAEQRRWYEAAVALANLCGSSEGEALARHVERRMRARAAGEE